MTEKIGNVILNKDNYSGNDMYSDGDIENILLEIVQNNKREDYEGIIMEMCKWSVFYHLSELRCNCIEWIDFGKDADVLEIGSGCGALTGCLADKSRSLTCIELSERRSRINAYRNSDKDNIEIYVGNFQQVYRQLNKKFDVITLIGVLEYGQLYIDSANPYVDFLKSIKSLLKPNGRLVIAIENKLGMKYWAGCKEDHTGRYYESIENYPSDTGIRTFGRSELKAILSSAGFDDNRFYYAYPDYKFTTTVYSDEHLPAKGELNNNMRNFDGERFIAFDEKKAFDTVTECGLFPEFSNSFIVITGEQKDTEYVKYSNERCPELCINTKITENEKGEKQVIKSPMYDGKKHISDMAENCRKINEIYGESGFRAAECHIENGSAVFEFIKGITLKEKLEQVMEGNDIHTAFMLMDDIRQRLENNKYTKDFVRTEQFDEIFGTKPLPNGLKAMDFCCFDMAFDNLIINEKGINIIDYEWCFDFPVPIDYIIYRAMKLYIELNNRTELKERDIYGYMGYNSRLAEAFDSFEENFQQYVSKDAFTTQELYDRYRGKNYSISDIISNADTSEDHYTQVYLDKGTGFNEENSYRRIFNAGEQMEINIPLTENVKACRFDPEDDSCIMIIKRIAACSDEGMYVPEYTTNGCESHGTIYFSQSDPQIVFKDIKKGTSSLQLKCIIYTMDSSHIDGIAKAVYDNSGLKEQVRQLTDVSQTQQMNIEKLLFEKTTLEQQRAELTAQLESSNAYLKDREQYISAIENSRAWKMICKIRRLLGK